MANREGEMYTSLRTEDPVATLGEHETIYVLESIPLQSHWDTWNHIVLRTSSNGQTSIQRRNDEYWDAYYIRLDV